MKKTLIYTACVAALFSSSTLAQSAGTGELQGCVAEPEEKVTNVYFANGVGNTSGQANASTAYLQHFYDIRLARLPESQGTYEFLAAYNDTFGYFNDIIETLNQKSDEVGARQWVNGQQLLWLAKSKLSVADVSARILATVPAPQTSIARALIRYLEVEEGLASARKKIIESQVKAIKTIPATQNRHVGYYTSALLAGKRVFVVAHSQGNLFTNTSLAAAAAAQPNKADSLAMIGVATPAAAQFRNSFYRTAHDDSIINALRLIENVLPSNINNSKTPDTRSFFNHSFITDYMADQLPSRRDIDGELERLARSVPFPTRQAGEGAIRATLTWDAQPDVDLHAFEPSGSHVYYFSRRGSSGFLDVDDVTSFGPENYFVACNKIELGTYRIGVNYYRGSAPSTATVSLFLGDGRIPSPKTLTLPIARGPGGDNSPQILFTIGVTQENGIVRYTVQ